MTRPRYQPAIYPPDKAETLDRLYKALCTADLSPVEKMWLRNALQARRLGQVRSLDEGLGLDPPLSPAKLTHRLRRTRIEDLYQALQPCSRWRGANQIALILAGNIDPPPAATEACAALRADPLRPRHRRSILRYLPSDSDSPDSCQ